MGDAEMVNNLFPCWHEGCLRVGIRKAWKGTRRILPIHCILLQMFGGFYEADDIYEVSG